MAFKELSKVEYDALDVKSQARYDIEFENHCKSQRAAEVKEAADAAVKVAMDSFDEKLEKVKSEAKAEAEEQLKAKDEELNAKFEAMQKAWEKTTVHNRTERSKTMSDYIEAKFSTEEGEKMLKEFIQGNKKGLHATIEVSKAPFSTPAGSVAVDMTGIARPNMRAIHARNVVATVPTVSNMISFLRLNQTIDGTDKGIGVVAEGAEKPSIKYTPQLVQVPVEVLAGHITVTDRALDDVVGLRAWFALALPEAYLKVEDEYIFNNPTYGIVPLATAYVPDGALNPWDTLISAIAQVEKNENYANAIFVSPDGKKELLRNKGLTNGMYTYPIVEGANGFTLDGIPVYSTSIFKGNKFLVGDFSAAAVTYHIRKEMNIRYSQEHDKNFTFNLTTILIEGSGAIAVRKPDAFVSGDLVINPGVAEPETP